MQPRGRSRKRPGGSAPSAGSLLARERHRGALVLALQAAHALVRQVRLLAARGHEAHQRLGAARAPVALFYCQQSVRHDLHCGARGWPVRPVGAAAQAVAGA